jgi:putative phage-type endonuclease
MMNSHHDMFHPVIDTLKSTSGFIPLGDHTFFQNAWLTENQSIFLQSLTEANFTIPKSLNKKAERVLSLVTDAYDMFLKEALNPGWHKKTVEERYALVESIKRRPQIEQRTEEWYANFSKVLTASEFSNLFSSPKKWSDFVMAKARPSRDERPRRLAQPTDEMTAIAWGIRFEPVVKQILEAKDKCRIYESGRLQHPTNPFLAASPDGIIESSTHPRQVGRLVEIKCPYSRAIGGEIPFEYWIQMQIQMEVTDIDECEYVEVEILSERPKDTVDLSGCSFKGQLYLIKQIVEEDAPFEYKYMYGEIGSTVVPSVPEGYELQETIPWGLKKMHRKIVHRDRAWFESTKSWQNAFWADVERVKQGEELPQTPRKQKVCLIQDD